MGAHAPRQPPQHCDDLENAPIRCGEPLRVRGYMVPCNRCFLCRQAYARVLAHRIDLEASCYENVAFATLTYRPRDLPKDGLLCQRHMTLFLKRLRHHFGKPLRYYYCGEYGEQNYRPHFHAILFGYPGCDRGRTYFRRDGDTPLCCEPCKLLHAAWGFGRVECDPAEGTGRYVALYATKKNLEAMPPALAEAKEFAKWSLRPGLGTPFLPHLAKLIERGSLPPSWLDHGDGRRRPLGGYLRGKLAELLETPEDVLEASKLSHAKHQSAAVDASYYFGTSPREMGLKLEYQRLKEARERKARKRKAS